MYSTTMNAFLIHPVFLSQVIRWIQSAEGMLQAGFSIPGCLHDAEQLKKEHEQFQTAIEVIDHTGTAMCGQIT